MSTAPGESARVKDDGEIDRVFDILLRRQRRIPEETMLARRDDDGWSRLSADEVLERVNAVSAGLLELGLGKDDRVGILSGNRPEWHLVDLGAQQIGAVVVPLFPKMSAESYRHILGEAEPRVICVEDRELEGKLREAAEGEPAETVFLFDTDGSGDGNGWDDLVVEPGQDALERIEALRDDIAGDDLATIVYTSGTTGTPKGVLLTHGNLTSNVVACSELTPVEEGQQALSFLPLSHVFERMMAYLYMHEGLGIHYAREIDTVGEDMRDVAPHVFTTVPRLLEKVWERIEEKGEEAGGLRSWIFRWAVGVADDYELRGKGPLYRIRLALARKLVLDKWQEGVGGEIVTIVSGGAALGEHLARRFTAAGIDILEGYGLTETSPVISVNRWEKEGRRFGSVGKPLDSVEVRIADDGEIRCKGPNVTQGYLDNPEATEEAFDDDGFFRTGDLGRLDDDGFLWVEGRKKSVFKTSGGKYVDPQEVENRLTDHRLVEHAMLIGEDRKMVTALIQPAWDNLEEWASGEGISDDDREELVASDAVRSRYEEIIDEANQGLDHTEQVKSFRLVPDRWSSESGELTATMKLRRSKILERYEDLVEAMYED